MAAELAVPIMPNTARMPDGPIEKGGLTAWKRGVLEILGWWVRRVTGQIGTEVVSSEAHGNRESILLLGVVSGDRIEASLV